MTHIDVRSALQTAVAAPYSDLVTRPTGAAVRAVIEQRIRGLADGTVVYLDFSRIGVLDRSCCDELVAKLVAPHGGNDPLGRGYVVIDGLSEEHLETVENVLLVHHLALVVQFADGAARLVGEVSDVERRVWEIVMTSGAAAVELVADALGISATECAELLDSLATRRLLRREDDRFAPLGTAA